MTIVDGEPHHVYSFNGIPFAGISAGGAIVAVL
jgi:hypothetical protein